MIIHASLKTDIAYFYLDWFIERLKERKFFIPSEKPNIIKRYDASDNPIDKVYIHTRNPYKLIGKSKLLSAFPLEIVTYFTMYDKFYEPKIKERDKVFEYVRKISMVYGKKNTSIGYDHIFQTITNDADWHVHQFEFLCKTLHKSISAVYIDFSINGLCLKNESFLGTPFDEDEQEELRRRFSEIASKYSIELKEKPDADNLPDGEIDIGEKNACPAMCRHCRYITNSRTAILKKGMHNPKSPILIGSLGESCKIEGIVFTEKTEETINQPSLFDFFGVQ